MNVYTMDAEIKQLQSRIENIELLLRTLSDGATFHTNGRATVKLNQGDVTLIHYYLDMYKLGLFKEKAQRELA